MKNKTGSKQKDPAASLSLNNFLLLQSFIKISQNIEIWMIMETITEEEEIEGSIKGEKNFFLIFLTKFIGFLIQNSR